MRGGVIILLRNAGACEYVGVVVTRCGGYLWAVTRWGDWYSDSTSVSLSIGVQCCTFSFVHLDQLF